MVDRHHLLECILWKNEDGTFRKIVNRVEQLKELGIYDDYKLTIPIEHGLHRKMHEDFEKGTRYEKAGDNHPMYGKGYLISGEKNGMYGKTGENNPMYGLTGNKCPNWKGDNVGPTGAYQRAKKLYKDGKITEEEFHHYREALREYRRANRSKSSKTASRHVMSQQD